MLKAMIDCANRGEGFVSKNGKELEDTVSLEECFMNVKPFVLTDQKPGDKYTGKFLVPYSVDLDLPFSVCSFECTKTDTQILLNGESRSLVLMASCFLVKEINPRDYIIFIYDHSKDLIASIKKNGLYGNEKEVYTTTLEYIKSEYLQRLKQPDIGQISTNKKIKIKTGSKNKTKEIRKIVVIGSGKHKQKKLDGMKISWDYSHRWEVRGHWRKCKGMGKDREGDYCIERFTWVKAHEKGPEDAALITKTRVLKK